MSPSSISRALRTFGEAAPWISCIRRSQWAKGKNRPVECAPTRLNPCCRGTGGGPSLHTAWCSIPMVDPATFESDATFDRASAVFRVGHVGQWSNKGEFGEGSAPSGLRNVAGIRCFRGTVALKASDADPTSIGATTERQSRGTHVFTMHANTGFSAHLMFWVGWRGSMQQCPPINPGQWRRRTGRGPGVGASGGSPGPNRRMTND
jgi:hypothetical protein